MKNRLNVRLWGILVTSSVFLAGCGGPPPQVKSAAKQIGDAERSIANAENWKNKQDFDLALSELNNAKTAIKEGKSFASGPELAKLKRLDEHVGAQTSAVEMAKLTARPKQAAVTAPVSVDPEEAKKKADEEAEKKRLEALAKAKAEDEKRMAALAKDEKQPKAQSKDDGDEAGAGGAAAPTAGAAGAAGAVGGKSAGVFPAVTPNSPPIDVVQVFSKGNFVVAYFQIYNKGEKAKRIMSVDVYFKDKDNKVIIDERSVGTFLYTKATTDYSKIFDKAEALTMSSHAVGGTEALQLMSVGEGPKAAQVCKAGIAVSYDDNTRDTVVGPKEAAAEPALGRGFKLK